MDRLFRSLDTESYLTGHEPEPPSPSPVTLPPPSSSKSTPPQLPKPTRAPEEREKEREKEKEKEKEKESSQSSTSSSASSGPLFRGGGRVKSGGDTGRRHSEDLRSREVNVFSFSVIFSFFSLSTYYHLSGGWL